MIIVVHINNAFALKCIKIKVRSLWHHCLTTLLQSSQVKHAPSAEEAPSSSSAPDYKATAASKRGCLLVRTVPFLVPGSRSGPFLRRMWLNFSLLLHVAGMLLAIL